MSAIDREKLLDMIECDIKNCLDILHKNDDNYHLKADVKAIFEYICELKREIQSGAFDVQEKKEEDRHDA